MHDSDLFTNIGLGFRRAFEFSGRSCRSEFWLFHLFLTAIYLCLVFIVFARTPAWEIETALTGMTILFVLASAIPSVSLSMRRMHDIGNSGGYAFVPIMVWLMAMVESGKGENKYGDPCVTVQNQPMKEFKKPDSSEESNQISHGSDDRVSDPQTLIDRYIKAGADLNLNPQTIRPFPEEIILMKKVIAARRMTFKIESLKTKNSEILTNENDIESEEIYADVKSSSQICASCQFENKPNATFCGGCGKPLGDIICTNCQFENPNIASFCEGCGKELATS